MTIEPFSQGEPHPVEAETHLYRVVFWRQQTPDVAPEQSAWSAQVWDLRAEDVHEVIARADEEALADQISTLDVRLQDGHGPRRDLLVQIAGADPTRDPSFDGFHRQHPVRRHRT